MTRTGHPALPRVRIFSSRPRLHHAFSCYLFSRTGQFVLTRRAGSKRTGPGVRSCRAVNPKFPLISL